MNFRNRNLSGKFFLYFTWFESLAEKCVFIHLLFFRFIRTPWYRCNMHAAAQSHANRIRSKVDWFRRRGEMKHQWTLIVAFDSQHRSKYALNLFEHRVCRSCHSFFEKCMKKRHASITPAHYSAPKLNYNSQFIFFFLVFRLLFMFSARPHHNACIVQHIVERRTNGSVIARSRMERPQNYAIN